MRRIKLGPAIALAATALLLLPAGVLAGKDRRA
jgi:hypothetical protein